MYPASMTIKPFWGLLLATLLVSIVGCKEKTTLITGPEIDVTNQWQRHTIKRQVQRDHGHSTGVGDLDGDGRIDALIAYGARHDPKPTDGVYWLQAPANPKQENWDQFRLSSPDFPIRWSMALATADMDNDGDLDVVALSHNDSNVYLCVNPAGQGGDPKEPWRTVLILKTPGILRDGERVELQDMDGDGFRDVIFPRGKGKELHILFNPKGALDAPWQDVVIGYHAGTDAHDVICYDMDQDGDLDLVAASGDFTWIGHIYWYENPNGRTRDRDWTRRRISSQQANYGGLQVEDLNQDGHPDILATEAHGLPGRVLWFKGPATPADGWESFLIGTQYFPHAALAADLDGDTQPEYWVPDASHNPGGDYGLRIGGIVYYKFDASQKEWTKFRVAKAPEVGRQARAVDLDHDGDLDVVSTADHDINTHTISIVWWENKKHE